MAASRLDRLRLARRGQKAKSTRRSAKMMKTIVPVLLLGLIGVIFVADLFYERKIINWERFLAANPLLTTTRQKKNETQSFSWNTSSNFRNDTSMITEADIQQQLIPDYPSLEKPKTNAPLTLPLNSLSFSETSIPKRIYMFWDTGWDKAPGSAQLARKSWEFLNRKDNFEFVFLDLSQAEEMLHIQDHVRPQLWNRPDLTIQAKSDIIRVLLLHYYGGIWIDASVVDSMPLRDTEIATD